MALRFDADLTVTADGRRISVTNDADGDLVVITEEMAPLLAALPGSATPLSVLRNLSTALDEAGGTVRLRTTTTPLLTVGAKAHPGRLLRVVGLDHAEINSLRGVLVAARPPGAGRPALLAAIGTAAIGAAVVISRRRR